MKANFFVFMACFAAAQAFLVSVKNGEGKFCIVLEANATGTIAYVQNDEQKTYDFEVGKILESSGHCLNASNHTAMEDVSFSFYPNDVNPTPPGRPWSLKLVFKEKPEQSNNAYTLDTYTLHVVFYDNVFPNATESDKTFKKPVGADVEWAGEEDHGFSCSANGLSLTDDSSIVFKKLKVIAFGLLDSDTFAETQKFARCKLDIRTSDVVPIVVGACLAGLVIIVLIAYLIGRARAKRQGYASV